MKKKINQFALALLFLAIATQILIYFLYQPVTGTEPLVLVHFFPTYFLIINILVHYFLLKSAEKSPNKFVNAFMALTTAKMMISLIFILLIVVLTKPDFKAPAITFAVLYLLFMVLEVILILKDLNQLKNKS
jgi:hypothetical protein